MNYCTKFLVWVFLFCALSDTYAQQGCIATNLNNTVINLPCSTNCTNVSFQIPHLKSTENYTVSSIPYAPYAYTTPTGTELTSLYIDDRYSPAISLPFNFCFYGANYNQVVVGSNGLITFDVSNASCANAYTISPQIPYNGTSQCAQFATYYPRASIMGAYSDLDPSGSASPNDRKIEYRIEGTAPCRKFIASYYRVGVFGNNSCGRNTPNTFQIVIHETTGLVEVFFEQKACISATNSGRAILGIQNWDANQAVAAPGKNATIWNETNTAYRFTPSGATSRFVRSELLTMAGTVVATTTTGGSSTPGMLDISFSNICPASFPAQYIVRTIYRSCVDATEIFVNDTVTINLASTLTATTNLTQPSCASANGTIAINATGGTAPYQYSLDGVNFQAGNSFTVPAGTYTVYVKDNGGCTFSLNATLNPSSGSTSSSFSASACSSYTLPWGQVVTASGAYTNTYQSVTGCDSVVTA
ncbi:MAG TPA: SprB repeat-containing protein, partial [Chitinophagaceae bacterium]